MTQPHCLELLNAALSASSFIMGLEKQASEF